MHAFSKSLARDVAPHIRVNVLAPGFIETAFGDEADADVAGACRARDAARTLGHVRRTWRRPRCILASDAAAFVTGQTVLVNGGVVL